MKDFAIRSSLLEDSQRYEKLQTVSLLWSTLDPRALPQIFPNLTNLSVLLTPVTFSSNHSGTPILRTIRRHWPRLTTLSLIGFKFPFLLPVENSFQNLTSFSLHDHRNSDRTLQLLLQFLPKTLLSLTLKGTLAGYDHSVAELICQRFHGLNTLDIILPPSKVCPRHRMSFCLSLQYPLGRKNYAFAKIWVSEPILYLIILPITTRAGEYFIGGVEKIRN